AGCVRRTLQPPCLSQTASWHASGGTHMTGFVPAHTPAWQVSVWVQALTSLQAVPSGFAGFEHAPVAGSQAPASWHWSAGAQVTGFVPLHSPAWQVSVRVQALPSLQVVASGFAGFEHAPVAGSQAPASWHWSAGAQVTGFVPPHTPAERKSVGEGEVASVEGGPRGVAKCEAAP